MEYFRADSKKEKEGEEKERRKHDLALCEGCATITPSSFKITRTKENARTHRVFVCSCCSCARSSSLTVNKFKVVFVPIL